MKNYIHSSHDKAVKLQMVLMTELMGLKKQLNTEEYEKARQLAYLEEKIAEASKKSRKIRHLQQ